MAVLPAILAVAGRPHTLLLVEDSRFAAESVRLICRRAGLRLRRADTLETARRHLRVYRPDAALVDLGLPDGSGLDLIAELARYAPHRPRIVAVSGDADGCGAALAAGADAFCPKPFDMPKLLAALLGEGATALPRLPGLRAEALTLAVERNAGSDPMALHDDLKRAHALLVQRTDPGRVGYAGQFIGGIARSLHDDALVVAADLARQRGQRRPLLAALQERMAAIPAI
jgi:DNA-binding response OmpR family regulator